MKDWWSREVCIKHWSIWKIKQLFGRLLISVKEMVKMKQNMKEQLLTKTPLSLMFQLSIPAVIGMIVIGLYPLMDGIFAGKIIGQTAMTACGVAMPLTFFNSGVSTLFGVGSASVLSRAIWKGDQKTVDKNMGNLIFWVILFSVIITVGRILLAPHFLDMWRQ